MEVIEVARWRLEVDVDATRRAYEKVDAGYSLPSCCSSCRNYIAWRSSEEAAQLRELLESLGIDVQKDSEAYDVAGIAFSNRRHFYSGWFHAVGRILHAGESRNIDLWTGNRLVGF
jgi:hypothetical protein